MKDYYKILQVSPDAEREVIDAAYKRLARKYHPDVYTGQDSAERMREMNEAHEVLGDPEKRAEYDRARVRVAGDQARGASRASGPAPGERAQPPQRVETAEVRTRRRRMAMIGVALFGLAVVVAGVAIAIVVGLSHDDDTTQVASPATPSSAATVAPTVAATGTPAGTPTATPSAVEQQLMGMVLQLSDLPAGFSVVQEGFSTNEEVAGQGEDAAEVLARLTEWGRILSRGVVFEASAESGVLLVDSTVSLYEGDSGAVASFADAVDTARATDWQASAGEATDVAVEEVPPLDAADEMLWLRISGNAQIGDPPSEKPFIQDVILMRVGRSRGSVSIVSSAIDAAPLVESLVRAQAANMAAGL